MSGKNLIVFLIPKALSHRTAEENLGVGYLSAILKKNGFKVIIIDAWLLNLHDEELATIMRGILNKYGDPIFVGISTYISNKEAVLFVLKSIHEIFNTKVVAGGFGPSFFVKEFLDMGVDIISIGEGENTIIDLAYALKDKLDFRNIPGVAFYDKNRMVHYTERRKQILNIDTIPFPDRSTLNFVLKRKSAVNILSARGCLGHCSFCSVIAFQKLCDGKIWRQRSILNFVDELESLYLEGVRLFKVIDDSFIEQGRDEWWCKRLSDEITKRNMKLQLRGSITAENVTDKIIYHLKRAGFYSFSCGIESFSASALSRWGKRATIKDNENAIHIFEKYNILVQCGLILFDPYTTIIELQENLRYLKKYKKIVTKGIFSELYAAKGTDFTNKLLIDEQTGEHKLCNENYTYKIIDKKVSSIYKLLKTWQKHQDSIYNLVIDPLTAPKCMSIDGRMELYNLYLMVHEKDIEVFEYILKNVDKYPYIDLKNKLINKIEKCKSFFQDIYEVTINIYQSEKLTYDGGPNKYLC